MRGERVLVTGGAGFIGSNLAEALAEENDVVILDDLSTGRIYQKIYNKPTNSSTVRPAFLSMLLSVPLSKVS